MNIPWLTIITITKDDPAGLSRTLASAEVLRQAGVEHLVIDGGVDPAACSAIVGKSFEGITVHRRSAEGIADAFNFGLSHARGEWVWFLNGGDAAHEELDVTWLRFLLQKTAAEVVTGALHYDGEPLPRFAPPLKMQWPLITSWLPHPSTLVRRETLEKNGGFDPRWKIGMDFDLWYRLLSGSVVVDVVAIPFARFEGGGVSRRAETKALLLRENTAILWKHKTVIVRTGFRKAWLLLTVFLQAAKNRWF